MIHRRYLKDKIRQRPRHDEEQSRIAHQPSAIWRNPNLGRACCGLEIDQEVGRRMDLRSRDNRAVLPGELPGSTPLPWNDILQALDTIQQATMSLASRRPEPGVHRPLDYGSVRRVIVAGA